MQQGDVHHQLAADDLPVEGFSSIIAYARYHRTISQVRGGPSIDGWIEYPSTAGNQAVEWLTATVPAGVKAAAFSWSCRLGAGQGGPFPHRLALNGVEVLGFETPVRRKRTWCGRGCRLRFAPTSRGQQGELEGVMTLTAPARLLHPGQSARIRVTGGATPSRNFSFFLLQGFRDTVAYSKQARAGVVRLTEKGRATAAIICPRETTAPERFAAAELQRYLQAISGAHLPIKTQRRARDLNAVFVGLPDAIRTAGARVPPAGRRRPDDRIVIRAVKGELVLTGANPRCVLFAVYRLLHQLGCRWFEPGPYGERVPRRPTVRIGALKLRETPAFKIRISRPTEDQFFYTANDLRQHIDWSAKQGMNSFHFMIPPYQRLRRVAVPELRKRGMSLGVGDHNFLVWLPHALHARHPEYFPEVNGARFKGGTARCASSAAGVARFAAQAAAWARRYPEIDEIVLAGDDGGTYCQCAGCRRLRPMEQMQVFFNAAARAIHRRYPDRRIVIFSYTGRYEPSRRIRPYTKNVVVFFDTFSRCQAHALANAECGQPNKQEESFNTPDVRASTVNRYLCLALRQWRAVFKDVLIFENLIAHGRHSTPFPALRVLASDLRYYKDTGISGFAPQAEVDRWASDALSQYVAARLAWNVEQDWRELREEFCAFYGGAAPLLQRYFERLEARITERCGAQLTARLTAADIAHCRALLGQARRAAGAPDARAAVARTAIVFEHTVRIWQLQQLRLRILELCRRGRLTAARRAHRAAVACARDLVRLDERHKHDNTILFARSTGGMLDDYLNGYPDAVARPRVDTARLVRAALTLGTAAEIAVWAAARAQWQRHHQVRPDGHPNVRRSTRREC